LGGASQFCRTTRPPVHQSRPIPGGGCGLRSGAVVEG
jgi:hypothetical protein